MCEIHLRTQAERLSAQEPPLSAAPLPTPSPSLMMPLLKQAQINQITPASPAYYRTEAARPCRQLFTNGRPMNCQMSGRLVHVQSVHALSPLVGPHLLERSPQVLSCQRRLK